jgi:hypothetical protein
MDTTNFSNELNQLIIDKQTQPRPVSANTLKKYIQEYMYLSKTQNKTNNWITETSVNNLIKLINKLDVKPTGKLSNLNIMIMIKKNTMDDLKPLLDLRNVLNNKQTKQTAELLVKKQNELPPYSEIVDYIDDLYNTNQMTSFLINFLCFEYGLRNKDLNLFLITLENHKNATNPLNYLVMRKTDCLLVIADYKTANTYGVKRIVVRSRRVLNVAKKIGEGYLLTNRFGEPPKDDGLSYYINLYTTKDGVKLTESDYYKIRVKHLQNQPNSLEELNQICNGGPEQRANPNHTPVSFSSTQRYNDC